MHTKGLTILVIAVVIAVGAIAALAFTMQSKTAEVSCTTTGSTHEVIIKDNVLTPATVNGAACDKLKITNLDNETREIGFGEHEHHTAYDGVTEKVLRKGQSMTVTMSEKGNYAYHDHFHDEVAGAFAVK